MLQNNFIVIQRIHTIESNINNNSKKWVSSLDFQIVYKNIVFLLSLFGLLFSLRFTVPSSTFNGYQTFQDKPHHVTAHYPVMTKQLLSFLNLPILVLSNF